MSLCKLQASQCPSIGSTPHQPRNVSFPTVPFGKSKVILRSFSSTWFDKWGWLHWDESSQRAFCFTCVSACKQNRLRSAYADVAFISRGFQNWKDATIAFRAHETSSCHKEAVEQIITLPATTGNVAECLSSAVGKITELVL